MKKTLILGFVALLSVVLTYGFANAGVSGSCVSCHTMHNSQNGTAMNYDGAGTPNETLLRGDCCGCHAQNTAANVVNTIPQVLHSNATDLAGGNFTYYSTSHANVHNVECIMVTDGILGNTPPGYLAGYDPSSNKFQTSSRLFCAGQNGCHGNRNQTGEMDSIKGGHHGDDSMLKFGAINDATQGGGDGSTNAAVPKSYRFLYNVHGGENTGWLNTDANSHNEYKGAAFGARGQVQAWAAVTTISDLCAECHGQFHAGGLTGDSGIGTASPWLRHPTDAVIPSTGEYAAITEANGYSVQTPVGRTTIPNAVGPNVDLDSDVITCLSCHAAHGTDYNSQPDILRFDYSTLAAGAGCLRCHTQKSAY